MSSNGASRHLAAIVGANLRAARKAAGMNQRELSEKMPGKTSNQAVSDWERGVNRPSDENLVTLAGILDRPFAWFFVEHDSERMAA